MKVELILWDAQWALKGNTLIYNADSFNTEQNEKLEDVN